MPRKNLIRTREFPYHLTARTNNREEFPGDKEFNWKTITGEIFLQQTLYGLNVHAFVLMPNHFHLLASSLERPIDLVMRDFLSASTRILNTKNRRSGRVFGGRYFWSLVPDSKYYGHVLKYVLRNPVKAGLSQFAADHPFSTYAGEVGTVALPIKITRPRNGLDKLVPEDFQDRDHWLNSPHPAELNEAIRLGLRRKKFEISADPATRRQIDLSK